MTTPACTGTKLCTQCQEEKSVLAFAVQKQNPDGLHYECRECSAADQARRRRRKRRLGETQRSPLATVGSVFKSVMDSERLKEE